MPAVANTIGTVAGMVGGYGALYTAGAKVTAKMIRATTTTPAFNVCNKGSGATARGTNALLDWAGL